MGGVTKLVSEVQQGLGSYRPCAAYCNPTHTASRSRNDEALEVFAAVTVFWSLYMSPKIVTTIATCTYLPAHNS